MERTVLNTLYEIKECYATLEDTEISKSSDYNKALINVECLIGEQILIETLESVNNQKAYESNLVSLAKDSHCDEFGRYNVAR